MVGKKLITVVTVAVAGLWLGYGCATPNQSATQVGGPVPVNQRASTDGALGTDPSSGSTSNDTTGFEVSSGATGGDRGTSTFSGTTGSAVTNGGVGSTSGATSRAGSYPSSGTRLGDNTGGAFGNDAMAPMATATPTR